MFFGRTSGGVSWLVVGLGNVGEKYDNTRHNVGFEVADELAERGRAPIQKLKHRALTNTLEIGGEKVLLMKPVTYMNLSGEAVGRRPVFSRCPPTMCWSSRTTCPCRWESCGCAAAAQRAAITA